MQCGIDQEIGHEISDYEERFNIEKTSPFFFTNTTETN